MKPAAPILALALAFVALHYYAAQLTGRVVKVQDGDTITVLDADHTQHKIRLAGIDAPEMHQAFGTRSRRILRIAAPNSDRRPVGNL